MKTSLFLIAAVLSFSFSAHATQVYDSSYGRWVLKGYSDPDPDDSACVLSTYWPDGRTINVNVFPKYDGSANVTMTVRNPRWNNSSWTIGAPFRVNVDFYSSDYGNRSHVATAQIYTGNKVIFRGLNRRFANGFIHFDRMVLFAGQPEQLVVNLEGTAGLSAELRSCIASVMGRYSGGFGDNDLN